MVRSAEHARHPHATEKITNAVVVAGGKIRLAVR